MSTLLRSHRLASALLAVMGVLALTGLTGCQPPGKNVSVLDDGEIAFTGKTPKGQIPTYETLAAKYNKRVAAITRFKSLAQIEIVYHDRQGKRHYEQADQGRVIMLLPEHMAVLVRKFGVGDLFLAGSNDKDYWLFDLTQSDQRILYRGSKAAADAGSVQQLPVPVAPRDLPALMGLTAISNTGTLTPVPGGYMLQPDGQRWRVMVDPESALPLRVDLLETRQGKFHVYMTSLLTKPDQVETYNKPPGAWPKLMSRIELRPRGTQDFLVVHISDIQDQGADPQDPEDGVNYRGFNLKKLTETYKPDQTIDLDQPAR